MSGSSQNSTKFPLMFVVWKDAESDSEWGDARSVSRWAEKDALVYDIGWKVFENKKYMVICSQVGPDGDYGNRTKIPQGWILRKQKITFKPKHTQGKKWIKKNLDIG